MQPLDDGWHPDPFRIHEERFFKQGEPTPLVKDDGIGFYDKPPGERSGMSDPSIQADLITEGGEPTALSVDSAPMPPAGLYHEPMGTGRRFWSDFRDGFRD